jgi:hypothetical protein
MMKKEFEDRIGLTITTEEYATIEQAYRRNGGMQALFDKRLATICHLREDLAESERYLNCSYNEAEKYRKQIKDLKAPVNALEGKIAAISGLIAV